MKGETVMRCTECGSEIAENDVICRSCGAEIITVAGNSAERDAFDDVESVDTGKTKKNKKKSEKAKRGFVLKIAAAVVVIAVIAVIIVNIVISVKAAEGRRLFDKVPLGRDVEKISADTGVTFLDGEGSIYGALNYIADYDYICESEKSAEISGIQVPEWAVLLNEDGSGSVNEAVLYNFSVLKHNWMGIKNEAKIDTSVVEFGMKIRDAERAVGLKPYTIIKESGENTTTYTYRYHYTDEADGNNCVMNLYIEVSDVDGQVKNVYDEKLDYLNLILRGTFSGDIS